MKKFILKVNIVFLSFLSTSCNLSRKMNAGSSFYNMNSIVASTIKPKVASTAKPKDDKNSSFKSINIISPEHKKFWFLTDEKEKQELDLSIFSQENGEEEKEEDYCFKSSTASKEYYDYYYSKYFTDCSKHKVKSGKFNTKDYCKSKLHIAINTEFFRKFSYYPDIIDHIRNGIMKIIKRHKVAPAIKVYTNKFFNKFHGNCINMKLAYNNFFSNNNEASEYVKEDFIGRCLYPSRELFLYPDVEKIGLAGRGRWFFYDPSKDKDIYIRDFGKDDGGFFGRFSVEKLDKKNESHKDIIYRSSVIGVIRNSLFTFFTLYAAKKDKLKSFISDIERFLGNIEKGLRERGYLYNGQSIGIDVNVLEHDAFVPKECKYCYFRDGGAYASRSTLLYKDSNYFDTDNYKDPILVKGPWNAKEISKRIEFTKKEIEPYLK